MLSRYSIENIVIRDSQYSISVRSPEWNVSVSPDSTRVVESAKEVYQQTGQWFTFCVGALQCYKLKEGSLVRMAVLEMSENWPLAALILLYLLSIKNRTHSSLRITLKTSLYHDYFPPLGQKYKLEVLYDERVPFVRTATVSLFRVLRENLV